MVSREDFALPKENLLLVAVGFVIILIGCICMIGGGSEDGVSYNPEIFSTMRITVAPIILVFGFFFEIFAIVWLRGGNTVRTNKESASGYNKLATVENEGYEKIEHSENDTLTLRGPKKQGRR